MSDTMTMDRRNPLPSNTQGESHINGVADAGDVTRRAPPFAIVIDDEKAICRFIALVLAGLGVESATYPTAAPAIASLEQRRPEIIFLDVALEQSDAIDVIKGLSAKNYTGIIQ